MIFISRFQAQWLFITLFFLIWDYILVGIVQGQIVDAFVDIRGKIEADEADLQAFCFICSLDRFNLDKVEGFFEHVQRTHSPWSYWYFLQYNHEMRDMTVLEPMFFHRTGLLAFIESQVRHGESDYIPVGTSHALYIMQEGQKDSEEQNGGEPTITMRISAIESMLKDVQDTQRTLLAATQGN